jgi:hypothetical protein
VLLGALVDKSLVQFGSARTGLGRCWLPTAVRQYAAGLLEASLRRFSKYQTAARTLYPD